MASENDIFCFIKFRHNDCYLCKFGRHQYGKREPKECRECGFQKERNEKRFVYLPSWNEGVVPDKNDNRKYSFLSDIDGLEKIAVNWQEIITRNDFSVFASKDFRFFQFKRGKEDNVVLELVPVDDNEHYDVYGMSRDGIILYFQIKEVY